MQTDTVGRKAIAGALILVVGLAVVALKGDIPENLLALLQVLFGGFVLGNAVEHASEAVRAGITGKDAVNDSVVSAEDIQYLAQQLESQRAVIDQVGTGVANTQAALSLIITKYGIDKQ